MRFSPAVLAILQKHNWPGNIRELQNVVERGVVVSDSSDIKLGDLPPDFADIAAEGTTLSVCLPTSLDEAVRDFKRCFIQRTLIQTGDNKVQAARILGIARSSLHRLIDELAVPDVSDRLAAENDETYSA